MTADVQQAVTLDDFSGGVIDSLAVSDSLLPRNCVRKSINWLFDRPRGALKQRNGTKSVDDAAVVSTGNTIQGVHNFRQATGTGHRLFVAVNGKIYILSGTSWVEEVTGLSTTAKTRFMTFVDITVALNGVNVARTTTGGGTWITTGGAMDVGNWPTTSALACVLNGRVFTAGNTSNPSRVYYSSIVASDAVSWTSGNGNFDVKPNDAAGVIRSLISNGRIVLILKERGMYRYDGNSLEFITNIGTTSHESVVTDDQGVTYFFGQGDGYVGFYATTGGYPKKLSRPIQSWVEAIAGSAYTTVAGYADGNKIVWYVGSCTIDSIAYTNTHLAYNTSDQTWEIYSYQDSFRCFSKYIDGSSNIMIVGGDTDGFVQQIGTGNTDGAIGATAGVPIFMECDFSPLVLGTRTHTKSIGEIITLSQDAAGANFYLKADAKDYKFIGSVRNREDRFQDIVDIRGQTIFPRLTAVNDGTPMTFEGFAITKHGDEGISL